MIDILVVDDLELIRTGICRLLTGVMDIRVVGQATTGEEAIKLIQEKKPDVVLMDVKMPGIGGLEATRKIQQVSSGTKVIALTVCEGEPFPSKLLQAGAWGYLTKGASLEEMVLAIRTVYSGQRYFGVEVAQQLAFKTLSPFSQGTPFPKLSDREMQVLLMITSGQKVQQISEELSVAPKTINTYRYRLFDKLNVNTDVELAQLAIRHRIVKAELEQD